MIIIPNITRGCGKMKPGGSYAIGAIGDGGTLFSWVWLLRATEYNVPPRKVDPTLADDLASEPWIEFPLPAHRKYVLLDHVGKDNYDVFEFAAECTAHGPSRRIDPHGWPDDVQPPLPIFFTHDHACTSDVFGMSLPLAAIVEVLGETDLDWTNTWERPGFGYELTMDGGEYRGWDHPMVKVYAHLAGLKKVRKYTDFIRRHDILFEEGIFGMSWITNLIYVLKEDEAEVPADIAAKGFEAAVIGDEEEEHKPGE